MPKKPVYTLQFVGGGDTYVPGVGILTRSDAPVIVPLALARAYASAPDFRVVPLAQTPAPAPVEVDLAEPAEPADPADPPRPRTRRKRKR